MYERQKIMQEKTKPDKAYDVAASSCCCHLLCAGLSPMNFIAISRLISSSNVARYCIFSLFPLLKVHTFVSVVLSCSISLQFMQEMNYMVANTSYFVELSTHSKKSKDEFNGEVLRVKPV